MRWIAGGVEGLGGTLVIWGGMSGGWVVIKGVGSDGGLVWGGMTNRSISILGLEPRTPMTEAQQDRILHDHIPEVNWQIQEVTLSQCPAQCHTCKTELQEQWREEAKVLAGPTLQMVEEDDELEDTDDSEHGKSLLEPGDCLLTMILTPTIPASGSHCHHDHISAAGREGPVEHTHEGERPGSPIPLDYMLQTEILEADDGVAESNGGDVRGTWLQPMCCTLPKHLYP